MSPRLRWVVLAIPVLALQNLAVARVLTVTGTGVGPIPDGLLGQPPQYGAALVVSFPVSGIVGNLVRVNLNATLGHTRVGDVRLQLLSPGGAISVPLAERIGAGALGSFGDDSNFAGSYTFDDIASGPHIWSVATSPACGDTCSVTPGLYRATGSPALVAGQPPAYLDLNQSFGVLVPQEVNGTWSLFVSDAAAGETGSVTAATLTLTSSSGKGDLNRDGQSDLVFRNSVDGVSNLVWMMNGVAQDQFELVVPDAPSPDWIIRGVDDFGDPGGAGDLQPDLVFWNRASGAVEFWLMNGHVRVGAPVPLAGGPALPPNWDLSATADFDHDGRADIVWRNFTSQNIVIWTMNGTTKTGALVPTPAQAVHANWTVVAATDYDEDGNTDLLWYNVSSGKIVLWYLDALVVRTSGIFTTPAAAGDGNWKVVASADYSASNSPATPPFASPDIVWRNATSGKQVVWHMGPAGVRTHGEFTSPASNEFPLDWAIVGPR